MLRSVDAGLQDHGRPVRWFSLTFMPHLLGHARQLGHLRSSTPPRTRRKERIGRMLEMHANDRKDIKEAFAGDIVAAGGPQGIDHRATRCATRNATRSSSRRWNSPSRSSTIAIEPKTKADQEKLGACAAAASRLLKIPVLPRFDRSSSPARRALQRHGRTSPRHQSRHRMKREFKVEANVGAPQVAYREYARQEGGRRRPTPTRSSRVARASSARSR